MKGYFLLLGIALLFIKCEENTNDFEGGIPVGLRAVLNGRYWEADSISAYKFTGKSSTNPSVTTMLEVKGYRRFENNSDELILTLHDDRKGIYSTDDKNLFADIKLTNSQGIESKYYAYPPVGDGKVEIFSLKEGTIDGHFNFVAISTESAEDSLYVEAGSFKMALEDRTTD
jgi:hypothetical protein